MARALTAAACCTAGLFATTAGTGDTAWSACAETVVWQGVPYVPLSTRWIVPMHRGAVLHNATEPPCNDTVGSDEAPTSVPASAISGMSPRVAIWSLGGPLIAVGYLPYAAGSPLARSHRPADATSGCRLGRRLTVDGSARVGLGFLGLVVSHSTLPVPLFNHAIDGGLQVDGRTRVDGLSRNGVPYIGDRQSLHVQAQECTVPGARGPMIVARHVSSAGPIVPATNAEDLLGKGWATDSGGDGRTTELAAAVVVVCLVAVASAGVWRFRRRRLP